MKITKHAQSCFLIETASSKVLVDPGSYVFNEEGIPAEYFQSVDAIVITHEHSDHFDLESVAKIIQNNSPKVFSTSRVLEAIKAKLGERSEKELPQDLKIEQYSSKHGMAPAPDFVPPEVIGYVISDGKTSFYTPGDSTYLDPNAKADVIGVPICGQVVMDIATAKSEVLKLKPKIVIPMHYDNSKYPVNVNDFVSAMNGTGIEVRALKWGEEIEI